MAETRANSIPGHVRSLARLHPAPIGALLLLAASGVSGSPGGAGDMKALAGTGVGPVWEEAFGLTRVDGALHAAGPGYTARIGAEGIEFVPAFGSAADRPYPVSLAFESIRRGEAVVHRPDGGGGEPREDGLGIRIPRGGGVEERFEVRREGIEHSVLFEKPMPGSGDLVVSLRVETELEPVSTGEGFRFEKEGLGGVTIGAVTGIDADGRSARGSLRFEDGRLEYRLPASFVDAARYPLLLDPLLGSVITLLPFGSEAITNLDVAIDVSNGVYLVVWQRSLSAGASRIHGQRVSSSTGALVGGLITIQPAVSGEVIADPAAANLTSVNRFIVVYERTPSGGATEVRARTVDASTGALSVGSTLVASGAINPDIGGHTGGLPNPLESPNALVVWETTTHEIHGRLVKLQTFAVTAPILTGSEVVIGSGFLNRDPAVSRHGGAAGNFLVVWGREITGTLFIGGRVVGHATAALLTPLTGITPSSGPSETGPDCATVNGTDSLVVYEQSVLFGTGIACKTVAYNAAAGTLSMGPEVAVTMSGADPAVDFADTRYQVAYRRSIVTQQNPPFNFPSTTETSILLQQVDPGNCPPVTAPQTVDAGSQTNTGTQLSGFGVAEPVVCAVYSGDPSTTNDEGLVVWRRTSVSGLVTNPTTSYSARAHRVKALGAGGPVVDLAPSCGGAGTAAVSGPAVIANPAFAFRLTGIPAGSLGTLFNLSVPQPLLSCGSCSILPFLIVLPVPIAGGAANLPIPIPCDPTLVGGTLAVQWTVFGIPTTPCAGLPQVGFSNVLSVTVSG